MLIRSGTMEDAALLAQMNRTVHALHAEARPDVFKQPDDMDGLTACYRELFTEPAAHVFIAEAEGRAVGYAIAKVQRRPDNPYTYAVEAVFVDQICVIDGEQGKGYGRELMKAVYNLANAENIREIRLDVWEFNEQALKFYAGCGFTSYKRSLSLDLSE